ncbi:hypothetical protein SCALM49S_00882 [Streptomyces californicus]
MLGVLSVTGGIGLIFYGFAWLLLPADGEDQNEGRKLLSGRVDGAALAALLLALIELRDVPLDAAQPGHEILRRAALGGHRRLLRVDPLLGPRGPGGPARRSGGPGRSRAHRRARRPAAGR